MGPTPPPPPEPDPPDVEPVPVDILDDAPGLLPGQLYRGPVIEIPPSDLLMVRGRDRVPIAIIEVPAMGPFMGARAVTPAGLGPWLLLRRPDDPPIPHPAFINSTRGARPWV